ncbi:hypothetical protein OIU84_021170 [Salix udensis]|uniref:phosphogluconate dehydrogenase (NADP(+)-dependent, decarboxylating) n=1 Tax=Salix udensis TaxID=889485 RepID=A0AAD6KU35_9ROSI|nr:hypothetical protein OIU84_021170 [Salix udensis]
MAPLTRIGLAGLAVMGQNLALNTAEKGFHISVYNRTTLKVDKTVERAKQEGDLPLYGFHDPESFVKSIQKPRVIIMLVKAGAPVDQTIKTLSIYMEKGDCIIDGGNEWYENTERREKAMAELGLLYLGMGAFRWLLKFLIVVLVSLILAKGGSGNFVKMVHNGIEYGDMQLIAEACDVLKSIYFGIKDDKGEGYLVDKVLDKTGMKGTGKWTVQQAAELSVAAPTIASSLDGRFLSGLKGRKSRSFESLQIKRHQRHPS